MKKLLILFIFIASCSPILHKTETAGANLQRAFPNGKLFHNPEHPGYIIIHDPDSRMMFEATLGVNGIAVQHIVMLQYICPDKPTNDVQLEARKPTN